MSLDVYLYGYLDVGGKEPIKTLVYESNITHNLNKMADEVGIYEALWHPYRINAKRAKDIAPLIEKGLELLKSDKDRFSEFDAENEWGTYDQFIPWIEEYLTACNEYPLAFVETSI